MAGSTFGNLFRIMAWGESHGKGIGVAVDGCPAGLALSEADIQIFLDRRRPGQDRYATARAEGDEAEILSGVFEGKTTGTPICIWVQNKDRRSRDYSDIASCFRPGHGDYTFDKKFGVRDYRGGGRSSGRETVARVAAGAIAVKILNQLGISFTTYTKAIGPVSIETFNEKIIGENPLRMPDAAAAEKAAAWLEQCMAEKNSSGGVVACRVTGLPAGLGNPVFEKLDANLAKAMFSIGAVKSFEIGAGKDAAAATGKENNDAICEKDGQIVFKTNHAGGILGGISNGDALYMETGFKPTPSIASGQETVNQDGKPIKLAVKGRHDPVIVPRAVVVVECMTALVLVDALFENMTARLDKITEFYER